MTRVVLARHDGRMYPQQPYQPPSVHIERHPDRAGTVALWLIIAWIAVPTLLVVLCCLGCVGLGGLGLVGGAVSPDPSVTAGP